MARHTTRVEEVKKEAFLDQLHKDAMRSAKERVAKGVYENEGKDATAAEERRLLDGYEAEGYKGGSAFAAFCSCGWGANNPLPTQLLAQDSADTHEVQVYGGGD
jgi:hypothetical protein